MSKAKELIEASGWADKAGAFAPEMEVIPVSFAVALMHKYGIACLEEAAKNVETGVYQGAAYEKHIKSSITSKENLI